MLPPGVTIEGVTMIGIPEPSRDTHGVALALSVDFAGEAEMVTPSIVVAVTVSLIPLEPVDTQTDLPKAAWSRLASKIPSSFLAGVVVAGPEGIAAAYADDAASRAVAEDTQEKCIVVCVFMCVCL